MIDVTLMSVFLVGLLGGFHCASMCGGIVAVMGAGAAARARVAVGPGGAGGPGIAGGPGGAGGNSAAQARLAAIGVRLQAARRPFSLLIGYNLGRISSYTLAGVMAGAIGSSAALVRHWLPVQQAVFIATNLVLIVMGLHLAGVLRRLHLIEVAGSGLWRQLKPLASRSLAADTSARAFRAGLVWGWVPCGMVYGVLMAALLSGGPLQGGALLLAFGLGTLPNLLLLGGSAAALQRGLARPGLRIAAGALIVVFGLAGLARIDPLQHLHKVVDACLTLF